MTRTSPSASSEPRPAWLVIGVLGGIASGKTEVAHALAGTDGVVLEADALAHEALELPETRRWLVERLGREVVQGEHVDRAAVARQVFSSPALRRELEARIHPLVRERIASQLREAREQGRARAVLDVPLLIENEAEHGLTASCDALVFVEADASLRRGRAAARRGWTPDELERREAAQLPLEHKRARADYVLVNDGDLDQLRARTRGLLERIEERRRTR